MSMASTKKQLKKALEAVKKQTAEIKKIVKNGAAAPPAVQFVDPIEHIKSTDTIVVGANSISNTIDEDLPFTAYDDTPAKPMTIDGLIKGVKPPIYSDPRVMNPVLAAAPVQFSDPAQFGTFGLTDDVSPAFSTSSKIPKTNARIVSDASFEGFEDALDANGAMLVGDGKVITSVTQLPGYQIRGVPPHTTLPERSLHEPPATVSDFVDADLFDGLQGFPVDEKLDPLIAPGIATPASEFCAINYGVYDN
jgi:hypothetical protein